MSASKYAFKRVALVGEAACKLHPLTGQGFNLNMTAAAILANWIIEQMRSGGDIGSYEHWLKKYAEIAKRNELESTAIIEAFKNGYNNTLYGSESLGHFISFMRNVGIDLINANPLAKYNFVFFAAGCTTHPTTYEWKK